MVTFVRQTTGELSHANDLNQLQVAIEQLTLGVVNIMDYGAAADGTTDDSAAMSAAVADLPAIGGTVIFPGGKSFKGALVVTTNKRIRLSGYGATWVVATSTIGLTINQGNGSGALGCQVEGFRFDGASAATTTAIQLKNTDRALLRDLRVEDCTTGIHLLSTTSGGWVEETAMSHMLIENCTKGIHFEKTGTGTGSFAQTYMVDVGINNCTTGIHLGTGGSLNRSRFDTVSIWVRNNQTGFLCEGNVDGASFFVGFEDQGTPTAVTGLNIATGTINQDLAEWVLSFAGTFTNKITLGASLTLVWRQGNNTFIDGDHRALRVNRLGDSFSRFQVLTEASGGGGIQLGAGGGTNTDVILYRSAANVLKTDDQFVAADGIVLKGVAGAVTDGAFTVVTDNTLAIDTTNKQLYVRIGGIWYKTAVLT